MSRKAYAVKQREDLAKLSLLIREALNQLGQPAAQVAKAAGIHPSHLSQALNRKKALSRQKLIALAGQLRVPQKKLLQAAGYPVEDGLEIDLGNVTILHGLGGLPLKIVTDPRFIDSAVFMWIFSTQPFKAMGIDCELVKVDWHKVPEEVATNQYAIGFYNRRASVKRGTLKLYQVRYWSDLCLYRGYALMAHRNNELQEPVTLTAANSYLKNLIHGRRRSGRKTTIVSMGADTVWRLTNPLTPDLNDDNFIVESLGDPDFALSQFLNGVGDLFVGGLPQRLAARKMGCHEVLSSQNNPLLFSLNSLICSETMFEERKPILTAASALWFDTISKLKINQEFRQQVTQAIPQLLRNLSIEKHNLNEEFFQTIFSETGSTYEFFPDRPTDLLDQLLRIIFETFGQIKEAKIGTKTIEAVFSNLEETLNRELDKEMYRYLV